MVAKICWTRNFLHEQGVPVNQSILYQDNQSAILLQKKGFEIAGKRMRHLNIRYFFVKNVIARGDLNVEFLGTQDMIADFLTKPLQGAAFKKFRAQILGSKSTTGCGKQ